MAALMQEDQLQTFDLEIEITRAYEAFGGSQGSTWTSGSQDSDSDIMETVAESQAGIIEMGDRVRTDEDGDIMFSTEVGEFVLLLNPGPTMQGTFFEMMHPSFREELRAACEEVWAAQGFAAGSCVDEDLELIAVILKYKRKNLAPAGMTEEFNEFTREVSRRARARPSRSPSPELVHPNGLTTAQIVTLAIEKGIPFPSPPYNVFPHDQEVDDAPFTNAELQRRGGGDLVRMAERFGRKGVFPIMKLLDVKGLVMDGEEIMMTIVRYSMVVDKVTPYNYFKDFDQAISVCQPITLQKPNTSLLKTSKYFRGPCERYLYGVNKFHFNKPEKFIKFMVHLNHHNLVKLDLEDNFVLVQPFEQGMREWEAWWVEAHLDKLQQAIAGDYDQWVNMMRRSNNMMNEWEEGQAIDGSMAQMNQVASLAWIQRAMAKFGLVGEHDKIHIASEMEKVPKPFDGFRRLTMMTQDEIAGLPDAPEADSDDEDGDDESEDGEESGEDDEESGEDDEESDVDDSDDSEDDDEEVEPDESEESE